MPSPLTLHLPYPPSVNHYWGTSPRWTGSKYVVHAYLTDRADIYRQAVIAVAWADGKPNTITGPVSVEIIYRPPHRKKGDLDNLQKGLLDALQHAGVIKNDGQVWELRVRWDINDSGEIITAPPHGSAVVTIKSLVVTPALFGKH